MHPTPFLVRLMRKMDQEKKWYENGPPKKAAHFFQKPTKKGVKSQKIEKKVPIFKKWALQKKKKVN